MNLEDFETRNLSLIKITGVNTSIKFDDYFFKQFKDSEMVTLCLPLLLLSASAEVCTTNR